MNIQKNSSGKVLIIFLIIFVILSLSLAGLAMFFLSKEKERREAAESSLAQSIDNAAKLEVKLQDAIKQGFLLQEKLKEADEKINGLLDELELQEGIVEELKKENQTLKENLERETKAKDEFQAKLTTLAEAEKKIPELEAALQAEQSARQEVEQKLQDSEQRIREFEGNVSQPAATEKPPETAPGAASETELPAAEQKEEVELEKIVVAPAAAPEDQSAVAAAAKTLEGRIVTVDVETEFVIVNLGANHGIKEGQVLSVFRGEDRVGDIKVTRVQPEMSAADFVPPLSGRQIREDDRVTTQ